VEKLMRTDDEQLDRARTKRRRIASEYSKPSVGNVAYLETTYDITQNREMPESIDSEEVDASCYYGVGFCETRVTSAQSSRTEYHGAKWRDRPV
jgi:hypothetical protein